MGSLHVEAISIESRVPPRRRPQNQARVRQHWLKRPDKAGLVLRIETGTNSPEEFRVRNRVLRVGKQRAEWVQPRNGVKNLFRYLADTLPIPRGLAAGQGPLSRSLDCGGRPHAGQTSASAPDRSEVGCRGALLPGFNPMAQLDADLFKNLMDGVHCLRGNSGGRHRRTIGRTRVFTTG